LGTYSAGRAEPVGFPYCTPFSEDKGALDFGAMVVDDAQRLRIAAVTSSRDAWTAVINSSISSTRSGSTTGGAPRTAYYLRWVVTGSGLVPVPAIAKEALVEAVLLG
jgi:hypothetical protein